MPFVTYCMSVCYLFVRERRAHGCLCPAFGLCVCAVRPACSMQILSCVEACRDFADALFWAGAGFKLQYGHMLACCDVSFRFLPVGADVGFWRSVSLLLLVFYKFVSKSG